MAIVGTLLLALPSSAGAAEPVIEVPKVHPSLEVITRFGKRKLLVKSLTVMHAHNVNVLATCHHCLRRSGPKVRELETAPGITRLAGLDWVLGKRLHIRLYVTAPGAIGRYVLLGPAKPYGREHLVIEQTRCLDHGEPADCPEGPRDGTPTYRETVGGDAETWTDYKNAGGIGGPLIHSGESVEVSCAVQGYPVEDGDTWWYRIASSPWNDAYYASADAFYNNGQTSGSLIGTPPVDPGVPGCTT
jgi:hypothetical protein